MNPLAWSFRAVWSLGLLLCAALIGLALYLQYARGMDPCPLCILQRVVFMVMGLVFLLGALHAPRSRVRFVYALLLLAVAVAGVGIATRHLWIQSLPADQVPSCGAPLGYLIHTRSSHGGFLGVLKMVLTGSGECAKVEKLFGVPLPGWALLWFALLGGWGTWAALRPRRR